jgi:N-methylhydantoinase A/oxoprolinase/acetone carboxylase beta subunit
LETAEGIIEIANANMEKAVRVISIERGIDPRKFLLFCFGGAGGMHATEIASNLNISTILIPKNAGVLSALGLLMADSIKDYSKSILIQAEDTTSDYLQKILIKLKNIAVKDMEKEGFISGKLKFIPSMDVRYVGQSYEINIAYQESPDAIATLIKDFNQAHNIMYAYYHPDRKIELVNLRLKVIGTREKIKLNKKQEGPAVPDSALFKTQDIFYRTKKFSAPVYIRNMLSAGMRLSGPALIVDYESTAFIPPDHNLKVDGWDNLIQKVPKAYE